LTQRPNVIQTFTAVIYKFFKYARMFVPGKPLKLGLILTSKPKAYSSGAPLRDSKIILLDLLANIRLG
jgi:hypothetical protein